MTQLSHLLHSQEINVPPIAQISEEEPQTANSMSIPYSKIMALLSEIFKATLDYFCS